LSWKQKFNKRYATQAEHETRFQNYLTSIEKVDELNKNSVNVTYGLNNLADLTNEEFKVRLGYRPRPMEIPHPKLVNVDVNQAPSAFDWCLQQGKCTPIKDQGQCGSCWAFATTENIESVWAIGNQPNALTPLAPQEIVDCDTGEQGCNGGDPQQAYPWVAQEGGMDTESSYPYTAEDGTCAFSQSNVAAKISSANNGFGGSEQQMAANLASTAPFSIIVDASSWQYYTGGVLPASQCGQSLDHAVIAAGYQMGNYWNVRNSWGTGWGESGYIRLQFGQNTCGLTTEVLTSVL
jgi:C1A family cysteine protease